VSTTPGVGSIVRALSYVAVRDLSMRLRRLATHPVRFVLVVGVIGGLGALQVGAIATRGETSVGSPAGAVAGIVLVLCISVFSAVRRSPIRLRPGDVAWLVPSSRGPRSLLAWHLGAGAARLAVFGVAAGVVAMIRMGDASLLVFQPAVALTLLSLFLRGMAFLTHVSTTRRVPKTVAAGVAIALVAPAALPFAVSSWTGTAVLPVGVARAAAVPGLVLDPLLAAIRAPDPTLWAPLAVAVVIVAGLAVLIVSLGHGYQDEAARRTWERASVAAAYQDGSPLAGPIQELVAARLPANVPSFTRLPNLTGERALLWRAVANLRRSLRWDLRPTAVLLVAAFGLAVLRPTIAFAPLAAVLVLALPGFRSGVVGELEHLAIRTIPGRPTAKIRAADALPVALFALELIVVALPMVVVLGLPPALLIAAPGIAAANIASASLVALIVPTLGRRLAYSAALSGTAYLVLSLTGVTLFRVTTPVSGLTGPAVLLLGALWAVVSWNLAGRRLGPAGALSRRSGPELPRHHEDPVA
jgi:hypothetical protein